ncbi:LytTR family DNA-binding domain-containing protein [Paraglaciecola sp.]|uniref:LytR/AlgR family response regulator transcription factor n=1 Tax=Paraglaciecola sp. TaxID=1920173 RepID=UPI003263C564
MDRLIKVILVDDEPLSCEGLRLRLSQDERVHILAECNNAELALTCIIELQPDVVFLDIKMPGMSGLDLAMYLNLHMQVSPKIVFVTAFQEFAIDAFEFKAFDYLLKPFFDNRLVACIDNLEEALAESEAATQHKKLDSLLLRKTGKSIDGLMQNLELSARTSLESMQQVISLKNGSEWLRVKIDTISWIEAAGDYMCVHTTEGTHIIRKTLKQFEKELDSEVFARVSRSAMVNLSKLLKLTPNSNGEYMALLSTGDVVKVSRKFKYKLDELNPS